MSLLQIDETLLNCVITGTIKGLEMTGIAPVPIGASRFLTATRPYSVLVSLHGERNGTMTLNLSEQGVRFLVGRLFGEDGLPELSEDSFDGVCELGNIIAGRFKEQLLDSEYCFSNISLPALIVGANYNLYHLQGITTACVEFEISEMPITCMRDRFFTCAISLMRK